MRKLQPALLGLLLSCLAVAAAAEPPEQAIRATTERVRAQIEANRAAYEADATRFQREIEGELLPGFDTRYIGQLVLGPHWRTASETQRARFIEVFKNYLVRNYAGALLHYADTVELAWKSTRVAEDADNATVRVDLMRRDKPPVPIALSVRRVDGQWKVYDVSVEGVSLATNFRGQFNTIIRRDGLDALIARLEQREAAARGGSGAP
jgi:phospholipid transport system substrate-binding protein